MVAGVTAILSFAPSLVAVPETVAVRKVDLAPEPDPRFPPARPGRDQRQRSGCGPGRLSQLPLSKACVCEHMFDTVNGHGPRRQDPNRKLCRRQAADEDAGRLSRRGRPAPCGRRRVPGVGVPPRQRPAVLNEVPRAPFGFRWTVNAYRGCSHACTYCFARPTHTYLGFDMGHDFDTKIVVKVTRSSGCGPSCVPPCWQGELVAMGTNTDPYQRAEGRYRLTQGLVAVLAEAANPLSLLTKSPLIMRDLPLPVAAAARTEVRGQLLRAPSIRRWRLSDGATIRPAAWKRWRSSTQPGCRVAC